MSVIVKGGYVVPKGTPNMGDALHSFESRKSDGFGGKMSTKINDEMRKMYKKGINPDVSDVKIDVDLEGKVNLLIIQTNENGKTKVYFSNECKLEKVVI